MYKLRRKLLSQNCLYNRGLITSLVRQSSIGLSDTVLEIGPGKGFITGELLKVAGKVIAVEKDDRLVLHLHRYHCNKANLEIVYADFLDYLLPTFPYKVFANLPFSIEGKILRKLLNSPNPPEACYLIVDSRFAFRLSGFPHENQFSLTHKPWFEFSIIHRFSRSDFVPIPQVDAVLWRITKRENPLLPPSEKPNFYQLIERGFSTGQTVYHNLRRVLSADQLTILMSHLTFSLKTKPGYLSLDQWLTIYGYIRHSSPYK